MKKVLITGSAGLIGAAAVDEFREAGWRIVATDVAPALSGKVDDDLVTWRPLDITALESADLEGFDAVAHLGALTLSAERQHFGGRAADAREIVTTNVLGSEALFRLATQSAVPCVVWASTAGVYGRPLHGDTGEHVDSRGPFRPGSVYAHTKLMCEGLARYYGDAGDTRFVGVRPTFSYGLGRLSGISGQFAGFVADAISGRRAVLKPPFGRAGRLQLIYVADMARSLVSCAELGLGGLPHDAHSIVLNSPTRELLSIDEVVAQLIRVTGNEEVSVEAEQFDDEMVMPLMDTASAADLLGFEARYPFVAAVEDMARELGVAL